MAVGAVGMTLPEKGEADESWATAVVGNSTVPVPLGRDSGACLPAVGLGAHLSTAESELAPWASWRPVGFASSGSAGARPVFHFVKVILQGRT